MNELNFSNEQYKNIALNINSNINNIHSPQDAFILLINCLSFKDLENLCIKIQNFYSNIVQLSLEDAYNLTQSTNLKEEDKNIITNLALECIKEGNHLGNNTILDGKINTSSWISHSLYMSETCGMLAKCLNLDIDKAKSLGLLHDFGRKYDHTLGHAIKGFEKLHDLGWKSEAIGCLTHSFLRGGRCSNNDPAVNGFYIDENGNPQWQVNVKKDDVTLFLDNYKYNEYDLILNISDLMATDKGIVAPHERIADIATRRTIDPTNRGYFLADFTNLLIDFLNATNQNSNNFKKIKATKNILLDKINEYFNIISINFYNSFLALNNENSFSTTNKKSI